MKWVRFERKWRRRRKRKRELQINKSKQTVHVIVTVYCFLCFQPVRFKKLSNPIIDSYTRILSEVLLRCKSTKFQLPTSLPQSARLPARRNAWQRGHGSRQNLLECSHSENLQQQQSLQQAGRGETPLQRIIIILLLRLRTGLPATVTQDSVFVTEI